MKFKKNILLIVISSYGLFSYAVGPNVMPEYLPQHVLQEISGQFQEIVGAMHPVKNFSGEIDGMMYEFTLRKIPLQEANKLDSEQIQVSASYNSTVGAEGSPQI